jgi:hypothetical protein
LILPDGSRMSPAGASAAAAKMESNAGVVAAAVGFGLVGMLVASSAEDKARAARLEDYRRKELQEARLAKGETAHGFLYFIPPPATIGFSWVLLQVRVTDMDNATSSNLELAIKDLKYTPPTPPANADAKNGLSHQ